MVFIKRNLDAKKLKATQVLESLYERNSKKYGSDFTVSAQEAEAMHKEIQNDND